MVQMKFTVEPKRAMSDCPLRISASGLTPGEKVTLIAREKDMFGNLWESSTRFAAQADGTVDVSRDLPLSGNYDWVDAMGPAVSMKAVSPGPGVPGRTMHKTESFSTEYTLIREDGSKETLSAERLMIADGMRREVIEKDGIFGTLFMPVSEKKLPVIIQLNGSDGGIEEGMAAVLASHGFAVITLAYFNYAALPKVMDNIPLEYFGKAIRYLQSRPEIDGDKIGIFGGSFGGLLSLLVPSFYSEITACAANVPSGILFGGSGVDYNKPVSPFSWQGKPLPIVPRPSDTNEWMKAQMAENGAIDLTQNHWNALKAASKEQIEAATIKVENIKGPVMLISGSDDRQWPCTELSDMVVQRLKEKGFAHKVIHLAYENAGHSLIHPYYTFTQSRFTHPVDGNTYLLGGTHKANICAIEDYWPKMIAFFHEAFNR